MRETTTDQAPGRELVARVRATLAEGELAILPTETAYCYAARADRPEPLRALAELAGGPPAPGWTWHVGDPDAIERFPRVTRPVRRLVARYWPGPLTLVLPGVPEGLELAARDGWTAVRCVAHKATAGVLSALEFPVVMTGAARAGEAPAAAADELERRGLEAGVALLVDAGPAPLRERPSVLRVGGGRFVLEREGLHDLAQLRAAAGLRIGFVCTGNTCRSPMAEGIARQLVADRLKVAPARLAEHGFELRSMGVVARSGAEASPLAVEALAARGVDISAHGSSPALPEVIEALDRVYCMTASHLDALRMLLPPGRDSHAELLDPDGGDIPDPIGGGADVYRACASRIEECIRRRVGEWV